MLSGADGVGAQGPRGGDLRAGGGGLGRRGGVRSPQRLHPSGESPAAGARPHGPLHVAVQSPGTPVRMYIRPYNAGEILCDTRRDMCTRGISIHYTGTRLGPAGRKIGCDEPPNKHTVGDTYLGPVFKARLLLHVEKSVGPEQGGCRWKDRADRFTESV